MEKLTTTYTVWTHARYHAEHTEVWSGPDFAKALQAAVDSLAGQAQQPLDPAATAALHEVGGRPIQAWLAADADGDERVVFITR
jgi:hypothetical protein